MYFTNDQQQPYGTKDLHNFIPSQSKEYYFKKLWLYIFYLKLWVGGEYTLACKWGSKDNLWESLLSHHVGLKDPSQVLRFGCKRLYWLSHFNGLILQILYIKVVLKNFSLLWTSSIYFFTARTCWPMIQ